MGARVELVGAAPADSDAIREMLGPYLRELDGDATPEPESYPYLDAYWSEPARLPFLIRSGGGTAGFALVRGPASTGTGRWEIAEFYVVPARRRRGIGAGAVTALWRRLPGAWQVETRADDAAAVGFWTASVARAAGAPVQPAASGGRARFRFSTAPVRVPALVLFDLGGVACRFAPERRLPLIAEAAGRPPAFVQERLWDSGLSRRFDAGDFGAEEMHAEVCRQLDAAIDIQELSRLWASAFEPDEAVLELARSLRATARVGLFTNNPPLLARALPAVLPDVAGAFDPRFFSADLGARKPEPAAFRIVEQRAGVRPGGILLVDDAGANVEGALRAGWSAIQFTAPDALRCALGSAA